MGLEAREVDGPSVGKGHSAHPQQGTPQDG